MGELRKDYILDRWVIIASERGKRPHQFKKEVERGFISGCFFCPGHEAETPAETYRLNDDKGNWLIRGFPNKFPAVRNQGNSNIETHNNYYTFSDAFGHHEVLVETPNHEEQFWDLSKERIIQVLEGYNNRIKGLMTDGIKYVQVFKNHGKDAGTSIVHSHSQLIAMNKVSGKVLEEVNANKDKCHYCEIIEKEKGSDRRCFENEDFVAFCPYASIFPFEVWIFPKEHKKTLEECNLESLAKVMKQVLSKLKELNASFNYSLHYSPDGEDLHFHIEVLPRLSIWGGFEYNGTVINTMPPENAAKFYRGEE